MQPLLIITVVSILLWSTAFSSVKQHFPCPVPMLNALPTNHSDMFNSGVLTFLFSSKNIYLFFMYGCFSSCMSVYCVSGILVSWCPWRPEGLGHLVTGVIDVC